MGWIVPTKPLGQESLFQQIGVTYGDAQKLATAEKKLLTDMNDLMALFPQNQGVKTKIEFGEPKMIDGVELQTYTTKMDFDANDPRGHAGPGISFRCSTAPTGMTRASLAR